MRLDRSEGLADDGKRSPELDVFVIGKTVFSTRRVREENHHKGNQNNQEPTDVLNLTGTLHTFRHLDSNMLKDVKMHQKPINYCL